MDSICSFLFILMGLTLFSACQSQEEKAAAEACACMQDLIQMHKKIGRETNAQAVKALEIEVENIKESTAVCMRDFEDKYRSRMNDGTDFNDKVRDIANEKCPR